MTATVERPTLVLTGHKEKDGAPYPIHIAERHRKVLSALANAKPRGKAPHHGLTDSEITFATGLHMAAARRCELRDIGAVHKGTGRRNGSWVWEITVLGLDLLSRLNERGETA